MMNHKSKLSMFSLSASCADLETWVRVCVIFPNLQDCKRSSTVWWPQQSLPDRVVVSNSFLLQGSSLNKKITTQNSSRKSLKQTRFTGPSLPEWSLKAQSYSQTDRSWANKEDSETRPAAWKKQKPTELPRPGLDQLLGKDTSTCWVICRLFSVLHVSSFCELSPVLGWALMMQLSLSHVSSCK